MTNTDQLARLILQKHGVLLQLTELTERQEELVGAGDTTRLLSLLAVKQRVLADLQEIEKSLNPFRDQDPERRAWKSPELRQRIRAVSEQCQQMLDKLMAAEKSCETILKGRREDTSERLQGVHHSNQARNAYLTTGQPQRGSLDLSSDS